MNGITMNQIESGMTRRGGALRKNAAIRSARETTSLMVNKHLMPLSEIVRQLVEHRNRSKDFADVGKLDSAIMSINSHSHMRKTLLSRWKDFINGDDDE